MEQVSEVRSAPRAFHFFSFQSAASICGKNDPVWCERRGEAGPPGSGGEFFFRSKKLATTSAAKVEARLMVGCILILKRRLGCGFAQDLELSWGK